MGGAANHNSTTEGSWEARKRAALQAYHEWMPTRVFGDEKHAPGLNPAFYRTFQFGDLATLFMTETRITVCGPLASGRQHACASAWRRGGCGSGGMARTLRTPPARGLPTLS